MPRPNPVALKESKLTTGIPTFGKPRIISCAQLFAKHVALPRGCLDAAIEFSAATQSVLSCVTSDIAAFLSELAFSERLPRSNIQPLML